MNNTKITLKIDGIEIKAEEGSTILETAISNKIYIPNLCLLSSFKTLGIL